MEVNKSFIANVFIRAVNFQGSIEEFNIPGIQSTRTEHQTVGGLGSLNLHSGFAILEGTIKPKGTDVRLERIVSDLFGQYDMQVRIVNEKYSGTMTKTTQKVVYFLKVRFRNTTNAGMQPASDIDSEITFDIDYLRKEIDGVPVVEYDPIAYIYKVNGVDMLADQRAALGIS